MIASDDAGAAAEGAAPFRGLGQRAAGRDRQIYVAGVLALTEPGPAAAGLVVADQRGRMLAHRAHYLGHSTRLQAAAQALLSAMRLAAAAGLESPVFKLEDPRLVQALGRGETLPDGAAPLTAPLREAAAQVPDHRFELVSAAANLARPVALAPLVEWLPERTRRSERLRVRPAGAHEYEVESESQPGQVYRVVLRPPDAAADGALIQCECADFQYRGIPCKHLLAVAREAGVLQRLFYPQPAA